MKSSTRWKKKITLCIRDSVSTHGAGRWYNYLYVHSPADAFSVILFVTLGQIDEESNWPQIKTVLHIVFKF